MSKKPQGANNAKERQKALSSISSEELEKVKAHQASTKGAVPVDEEWLLLAEFAMKFGWQAYKDVKEDAITGKEMRTLIEASRKLDWSDTYRMSIANFLGSVSAQSKKPSNTFNTMTKNLIKEAKADQ